MHWKITVTVEMPLMPRQIVKRTKRELTNAMCAGTRTIATGVCTYLNRGAVAFFKNRHNAQLSKLPHRHTK